MRLWFLCLTVSQILPDNSGNAPHSHAPFFINPGDGKAHKILKPLKFLKELGSWKLKSRKLKKNTSCIFYKKVL